MAAWTLVPCLVALRAEFNQLAPARDKESDGTVGDQAHSASSSDHNPDETGRTPSSDADNVNEVHAIDVDKDLGGPVAMEQCVQAVVLRHRNNRDDRLQNVIYNGKIWSRTWGWTARDYLGANQHRKHAHFSARYTSAQEADTRPWGVAALAPVKTPAKAVEDDMPTVEEFWAAEFGPTGSRRTAGQLLAETRATLVTFVAAESQRDAQTAAQLAAMNTALQTISTASGALTAEQYEQLLNRVRDAAVTAGAAASAELIGKLDSLRAHLGDQGQAA